MATMKQVAARAGVSVSTVSHVINRTRAVSEDVRQRVQGIIDEMHYVPSAVARSLKNDKTHTIGVLLPNSSNPYFAELLGWIEEAAFQVGYSIILCNALGSEHKQTAYLRALTEKRIDGLLLIASGADAERDSLLGPEAMPIVQLERALPGVAADLVVVGAEEGAYRATRYLIELGHQAIACVSGPGDLPCARTREAGYLRAMAEAGLDASPASILHAEFTSAGGHAAFTRLLARTHLPTAVFATNDLMALGGLCAAAAAGIDVPARLSVVGFDDIAAAGYASPPLTTVASPKREMARLAVELLLERIKGDEQVPRRTVLACRMNLRGSSAPVRQRGH
jgi:LacI family transcriptional regulator